MTHGPRGPAQDVFVNSRHGFLSLSSARGVPLSLTHRYSRCYVTLKFFAEIFRKVENKNIYFPFYIADWNFFSLLTATLDLLSRALLAVHPRAFLSCLCECVSVSAGAACACTHLPIPEAEHNPPPSPCAIARHGRPPSFDAGPGASLTNAQHNPRINWSKCHCIGS